MRKTVQRYLSNRVWWQSVLSGDYQLDRKGELTPIAQDMPDNSYGNYTRQLLVDNPRMVP